MPLSINTNLSSLATQRALSQSQDLRTAAVQRLSSGLRINAARDDAAGLAISERLTAQVRGLAQSARNAQDAIGMSQTAEAALASISDNLQRVRELAVRAANGTNSAAERNSLDAEVQQRVAEIDRIAASTSFGEIKLLDGTAGMLAMQIGPNVGQTVGVDLSASLRSNAFGAMASVRSADLTARLAAPGGLVLGAGDLTVQVGSGGAVSVTGTFRTIEALASAVNAAMGGKGTASVTQVAAALANQATQQSGGHWDRSSGEVRNDYAFAALKADGSVVTWGGSLQGGNSSAVAAQLTGGVQALYSTNQAFAALKADGSIVTWGDSSYGGNSSAVAAQLSSGVQSLASPLNEEQATTGSTVAGGARLILNATEAITFGGTQRSILGFAAFTAPSGNVAGMRTTTAAEATETLLRADVALQTIATERARIGVTLNRFDLLIDDLATAGNNLTASRSRITDADVAAEIANLTRAQIVQQAGQAMLAQANTNARLILALLPT